MRNRLRVLCTILALTFSLASLVSTTSAGILKPTEDLGCCVCDGCDVLNETSRAETSGLGLNAITSCVPAPSTNACESICANCNSSKFLNSSCSSPQLAIACGDDSVMAPTASSLGLLLLAAVLSGAGAFLLRRRA